MKQIRRNVTQSANMNIRDDVNFLEYPLWVVSKSDTSSHLIIQRENGFYEIKSSEGLPVRFDKTVLYFLLHKLFQNFDHQVINQHPINHANNDLIAFPNVVTTRYEIAKNVLFQVKNFSKTKYDRIMLALKKWKALYVRFEGIFWEYDHQTVKYFSILDYVSLDKVTNQLTIKFNDQYLTQLARSKSYKIINFNNYKKLTRPVSARLYEILVRKLMDNVIWCISAEELGTQLTLEKREFPSQILVAIKPAIHDINLNTELTVELDYDKARTICIFKNSIDKLKIA